MLRYRIIELIILSYDNHQTGKHESAEIERQKFRYALIKYIKKGEKKARNTPISLKQMMKEKGWKENNYSDLQR